MTLRRQLSSLRGKRVAVIGDVMLDEFLWGDATRISPEAPVPVVVLERQTSALGGAANVAANITALGGHAILFSATGADAAGRRLRKLAAAAGLDVGWLPELGDRVTTVKHRVFARNKHMLRVDRETIAPWSATATRRLLAALARSDFDGVAVSDYGKGCITPALARGIARLCRQRLLPWCVDPKTDTPRFRGATILKPNLAELRNLSGLPVATLDQIGRAADRLGQLHACVHVLVTRGEHGMALFGAGQHCLLPSQGHAVADVTGAGDTVLAVLGLALAAKLSPCDAAALANRAAGYVVGQPGIAVIRPGNLLH